MAVTTIASPTVNIIANTPVVTLNSGDTLNLLAGAGLFNYGIGTAHGVSAAGANSITLNSEVLAYSSSAEGLNIAAGGNDINIGAACLLTAGAHGILINGGGNSVGV